MHSHASIFSLPVLDGADDSNSQKSPILPFLRALDGMNTHDESFLHSIAGGVTTGLVIPGSGNAIGNVPYSISFFKLSASVQAVRAIQ